MHSILGGATERSVMSIAETSRLMSDVIPRTGELANGIAALTAASFLLLLVLMGLLRLSWQLTIIVFGFGGSLGFLLLLLRNSYGKYVAAIHPFLRRFNNSMIRAARNNHLLRVHGVNETEARALVELSRQHLIASEKYTLLFAFSSTLPAPIAVFAVTGIFWLNVQFALVPVETLVPLVYLLSRTSGAVAELSTAAARVHRTWPYLAELRRHAAQLFPDLDQLPAEVNSPSGIFPLAVQGLQFGRSAPLSGPVSFSAGAGDVVLVSGPSGRGKTTFVMTLIGLLHPIGEIVSWGGKRIDNVDPQKLRHKLGYAGPEPYLIDADIRANLLFGVESGGITDAELGDALRLARAEFVYELQGGLSHQLREAGEGISAGQKQRLALARCILRRPEVLLLDEATSNIDEDTEKQIMDGLKTAFPDLLIIAVSHRASLRRYATVEVEL